MHTTEWLSVPAYLGSGIHRNRCRASCRGQLNARNSSLWRVPSYSCQINQHVPLLSGKKTHACHLWWASNRFLGAIARCPNRFAQEPLSRCSHRVACCPWWSSWPDSSDRWGNPCRSAIKLENLGYWGPYAVSRRVWSRFLCSFRFDLWSEHQKTMRREEYFLI